MKALVRDLERIVGREAVVQAKAELATYECDAYTLAKGAPSVVVLPSSTEEVAAVVRYASRHSLPIVPRGAGTGLSGGATPIRGGIVLSLARMTRILKVDIPDRQVCAEAGVTNLAITRAVEPYGFFFAPDPSSQAVATLGGNVAANAGGPHTLRYGTTVHHLLGLLVVTAAGEIVRLGNAREGDLVGLIAGSEGTLAVATEICVRIIPKPELVVTLLAVLPDLELACAAVCEAMRLHPAPSAVEMMDRPVLEAAKSAFGFDPGEDAEVVLLIEFEGPALAVRRVLAPVQELLREAIAVSVAMTPEERAHLWHVRKKAVAAFGHLAPSHASHDGTVPRSQLASTLRAAQRIAADHGLRVANVFHAGDGNLHPVFLFDEKIPEQTRAVEAAGHAVMRECLLAGGTISGEHGIGVEKREIMGEMFSGQTLALMRRVKEALDPAGLLNPSKLLPDRSA